MHPDAHKQESLVKQRYESNADVQRWLKTQVDHNRPEFGPEFLREHRDRDWILSSLTSFYNANLITDVLRELRSGKEATVYLCRAHPGTDKEYLAAKIYRPRIFRSLKNDAVYRNNRHNVVDRRLRKATQNNTRLGRAVRVDNWIRYEYQTQCMVYDAGCDVPKPVGQYGNAVLMEYIGDEAAPAPMLRHVSIRPEEARIAFDRLIDNIRLFLSCDRIHGDLSPYNILYWRGEMKIIDFAQAVDARAEQDVLPLLFRDVNHVARYFTQHGLTLDPDSLARKLWSRYIRSSL